MPAGTTKKGRTTKIQRLEKECDNLQKMIEGAREFAMTTGTLDNEMEFRLKVMQLDLDSKRLFINFLKGAEHALA